MRFAGRLVPHHLTKQQRRPGKRAAPSEHNYESEYGMTKTTEMRRTWLIQRLQPPHSGMGAAGPFSFGGGLRNGGLNDDALRLLGAILRFDYMGAAEFEFGAVPNALSGLAKDAKRLVGKSVDVDGSTIYVLARSEHLAEVVERVNALAVKDYTLKEATHLPVVLNPSSDPRRWTPDTCGWLELDNGFMFFTDREMWERSCALFGVAVSA